MNKLIALSLSTAVLPVLVMSTAAFAQNQATDGMMTDDQGTGGQFMNHRPDGSSVPDYLARREVQFCSADEGADMTRSSIIGEGHNWQLSGIRQSEGWGGITWSTRP